MLGYYISLLKILSLRLTKDTIFFFKNEVKRKDSKVSAFGHGNNFNGDLSSTQHKEDFPLFTNAIKLSDNRDAMVRASIRNLTLMVFKGERSRQGKMVACLISRLHLKHSR